jgi:Domain of unknown function (DUF6484)
VRDGKGLSETEPAISAGEAAAVPGDSPLAPLLHAPARSQPATQLPAALIGELIALADGGNTALVRYPGQTGEQALAARTTVDLHSRHIGQAVLLMFEQGDSTRPIVTGVVRGQAGWPLADPPAQVEVDVDGQRMIVSAKEQLVLRCGKASITLTKAGKVLIDGTYVLNRSSGVNRIKGGSVQLN